MFYVSDITRAIITIVMTIATIVFGVLSFYFEPNIAYFLRQVFSKHKGGRRPSQKPKLVWSIYVVCIVIMVIGATVNFVPSASSVDSISKAILEFPSKQTDKFRIIVTNLDDKDRPDYKITNLVVENLEKHLENYPKIEVYRVDNISIPPDANGRELLKRIAIETKANIIIWGWYGVSETITYGIHLDVIETKDTVFPITICPASFEKTQEPIPVNDVTDIVINLQNAIPDEFSRATLYELGTIYYSAGEYATSLSMFNDALEVVGNDVNVSAQTQQGERLVNQDLIYYFIGKAYAGLGDIDSAISNYDKILPNDPQNIQLNLDLGHWYSLNQNFDQSLVHLNLALASQSDVYAYYFRGLVYQKSGKYDLAKSDFDAALSTDEKTILSYIISDKMAKDNEALNNLVSEYTAIISTNPNALAFSIRGIAYWDLGNNDAALSDFSKSLDLYPVSSIIRFDRSEIYYSKNQSQEQINDLSVLIGTEDGAQTPCLFHNRAEALLKIGEKDSGKNDYEKAIELSTEIIAKNPNNAYAYGIRGASNEAIGNHIAAYGDYIAVSRLDPGLAKSSNIEEHVNSLYVGIFVSLILIIAGTSFYLALRKVPGRRRRR